MTLKKVAALANVSVSTASKALKNSFDVSEETRRRVLAAAEECGYFGEKKRVASENRKSSELMVAVVCPEVISPYYSAIIESITAAANKLSYNVVIYNASFDRSRYEKILLSCFDNPRIDAVINLSSYGTDFQNNGTPHISFYNSRSLGSTIITNYEDGYKLIKSTMKCWKNVAFASESLTQSKADNFLSVFPDAEIIVGDGRFEDAGRSVAEKLLENPLPDAVVCAYDEIAFGLIDTLKKNGISIPSDIEVVGINNVATSKWAFGGVSTLTHNLDEIFDQVLMDITHDIKNKSITKRNYQAIPQFIRRSTTK